jgi:hypothetical protein
MPSTQFNIVLLAPPGYTHAESLLDVCHLLHASFESLGYSATFHVNELHAGAINVVVGYHLVADAGFFDGFRVVFYQLEQLVEHGSGYTPERHAVLQFAEQVWDYSPENAEFLRSQGLRDVRVLPLGFHEKLKTIAPVASDIDILFYGSLNERRRKILDALMARCRARAVFGRYGKERDALIARSKIILNIHRYEAKILEQVRISYLLNNGCFVISEDSAHNPLEGMIVAAPYERLVETCMNHLANEAGRIRFAAEGMRLFSRRPMAEFLRAILE